MRKICVFTGSRAEYDLLKPLMSEIVNDRHLQLQILVSGAHLSPEFGLTYHNILADGFHIDEKVEIIMSADTPSAICKSMGLGLIGFGEALERLKPDILVILGDRFEGLSVASAAMVCRIPIAHIHGGEVTYGAIDEFIRHAITKMSHLHFTSTEEYRKRVIQLGEFPNRVFTVGALGVENIRKQALLSRDELEASIGFEFGSKYILVTYHPVTLEYGKTQEQFKNILNAIDEYPDVKVIFTKANADTEGRIINRMIDRYVALNGERAIAFTSMGQTSYLNAMKYVDAVVGNSSSGIIEAPSFRTPSVNIGDRQKGRIKAQSVIDCEPEKDSILSALEKAISIDFLESIQDMNNPYDRESTAQNIKETIKRCKVKDILKKQFYDVLSV